MFGERTQEVLRSAVTPQLPDPIGAPQYASGAATKPAGNQSKIPGFGSTLMTSGQGVDSTGTNTVKKSLLGV